MEAYVRADAFTVIVLWSLALALVLVPLVGTIIATWKTGLSNDGALVVIIGTLVLGLLLSISSQYLPEAVARFTAPEAAVQLMKESVKP